MAVGGTVLGDSRNRCNQPIKSFLLLEKCSATESSVEVFLAQAKGYVLGMLSLGREKELVGSMKIPCESIGHRHRYVRKKWQRKREKDRQECGFLVN